MPSYRKPPAGHDGGQDLAKHAKRDTSGLLEQRRNYVADNQENTSKPAPKTRTLTGGSGFSGTA